MNELFNICRCGHRFEQHQGPGGIGGAQCMICPGDSERSWRHPFTPEDPQNFTVYSPMYVPAHGGLFKEIMSWLGANGIDVATIPAEDRIDIVDGVIHYEVFDVNEEGRRYLDLDNHAATRPASAPVTVPWEV